MIPSFSYRKSHALPQIYYITRPIPLPATRDLPQHVARATGALVRQKADGERTATAVGESVLCLGCDYSTAATHRQY